MQTGSLRQLSEHKDVLCSTNLAGEHVRPTERMQLLILWFLAWAKFFNLSVQPTWREYKAQVWAAKYVSTVPRPLPFDEETVDGLFTRDTLKAALTPAIPEESWYRESHPLPEDLNGPVAFAGDSYSKTARPSNSAGSKQTKQAEGRDSMAKGPKAKKASKTDPPDEQLSEAVIEYRSRLRSRTK